MHSEERKDLHRMHLQMKLRPRGTLLREELLLIDIRLHFRAAHDTQRRQGKRKNEGNPVQDGKKCQSSLLEEKPLRSKQRKLSSFNSYRLKVVRSSRSSREHYLSAGTSCQLSERWGRDGQIPITLIHPTRVRYSYTEAHHGSPPRARWSRRRETPCRRLLR
jgi:hypothetical protein